jgi:drug/metabolite transporter (DMT)-like permease
MRGLIHVPAPQAGVFTVMLPLAAAAVGVAFLGERFGSAHVAALMLAIAGLLLATWPSRRR